MTIPVVSPWRMLRKVHTVQANIDSGTSSGLSSYIYMTPGNACEVFLIISLRWFSACFVYTRIEKGAEQ